MDQYRLYTRADTTFDRRVQQEDLDELPLPLPSTALQRRIADFLDDQVARIDNIIAARNEQERLWSQFLQAEVDAAFEASTVVPVSRLARVLPGWAFPSGGVTADEADVRLLRGINVGVGQIRWDETVYWPQQRGNEASAFRLASGDVVMGMDRPWIGEGLRIARIAESDLPCLLLQRVAKLQPSPRVNPDYLFWAYQASSFRREIEVELSGLSVPHLSGDQILRHRVPFLDLSQQDAVVDHLDGISQSQSMARACLRTSAGLLGELKRSLITAAVTGEFDVSSADGSGLRV
jgi:type I restriction enzyme, S subunit